jgi:hypothetical protein
MLRADFVNYRASADLWPSLLYALRARGDANGSGCYLYPQRESDAPALVLFDNVPGGAGHVRRLAESEDLNS